MVSEASSADTSNIIEELKFELNRIGRFDFPHAARLLQDAITRYEDPEREPDFLEVDVNAPVHVTKKVLVPVHRHPKFNFVGKLLGPGGKTLKELSTHNRSRIFIFGAGSTRNKDKEAELMNSGDPQYSHLREPLHVRIDTTAGVCEAYQRVASVLQGLARILQPIKDDLVMSQMEELGLPLLGMGSNAAGSNKGPRGGNKTGEPGGRRSRFDQPEPTGFVSTGGYNSYPKKVPEPPPTNAMCYPSVNLMISGVVSYPGYYYQGATSQPTFGFAPSAPAIKASPSTALDNGSSSHSIDNQSFRRKRERSRSAESDRRSRDRRSNSEVKDDGRRRRRRSRTRSKSSSRSRSTRSRSTRSRSTRSRSTRSRSPIA